MTIITNEIYLLDGLTKSILVSAADSRVLEPNGRYSTHRKLFEIPYLRAYISYHGLAQVFPSRKPVYLSNWLPNFISDHTSICDLREFAFSLRDALHTVIPPQVLKVNHSGFHLLGYNSRDFPDFWYLSNIGGMDQFVYKDLHDRYREPTQDFLERDARKHLGYDGVNPQSAQNKGWIYRNGDIRAHAVMWGKLDEILTGMFQFDDFTQPISVNGYENYVRTKLEILAHIYKKFAKKKIIGTPIEVHCLSNVLA